jgi:sporulation protein YlmC with PRC-barrel domain
METQRSAKKVLLLSAFGVLISALGFSLMAHAGDESSVLKASDLIGMKVQGADDKKLGDIKDLVIDPEDGGVQYAVLDFGGFAGIGDKYFAVPWEALQLDTKSKKIWLDVQKKDLKDAPGFDKKNWPDLSLQQVVIYEFYDIPQPDRAPGSRAKR